MHLLTHVNVVLKPSSYDLLVYSSALISICNTEYYEQKLSKNIDKKDLGRRRFQNMSFSKLEGHVRFSEVRLS